MDTIGDAYIVAALLPPPGPGSASAAARVCQDLEARKPEKSSPLCPAPASRRYCGGARCLMITMIFCGQMMVLDADDVLA